jgi:hypothetical protein
MYRKQTIVEIRIGQSLARQDRAAIWAPAARNKKRFSCTSHHPFTEPGPFFPFAALAYACKLRLGRAGGYPTLLPAGDVCLGVQRQHEVLRLQTAVTLAIRPLALWWTLCFGGCRVVDSRIGGWQSESCLDSGRTRPRPMLRAYDKGQGTGPRANNSVLYRTGTALFSSLLIDRTGPFGSALRSRFSRRSLLLLNAFFSYSPLIMWG